MSASRSRLGPPVRARRPRHRAPDRSSRPSSNDSSASRTQARGRRMRFLPASDWHVGKTIGGKSRGPEHRAVLAEILSIARDAAVDCLLVTGDLFESSAPGTEAEEIVYAFFRDLGRAAIPAVVIA